MTVGPIDLQNLFLRSDQISRDIAHQAQAGHVQEDNAAHKLKREQHEQDERVQAVVKDQEEALKVNDDSSPPPSTSTADEQEQQEENGKGEGRGEGGAVREDYLGRQIDICQ